MSLGLWLFQQGRVSRKALQVFVGKEVHTLQFRRPLFSVYDHVWKLISGESDRPLMDEKAISEVITALGLFPLRFTDWRTQMDPFVMASDASEKGGGFVMARRLSEKGLEALKDAERSREEDRTGILVIDMFSGIGGLLRASSGSMSNGNTMLSLRVTKTVGGVFVERGPGGSEYTDILKVKKEDLVREFKKVDNLELVIAGGGTPVKAFRSSQVKGVIFEMNGPLCSLRWQTFWMSSGTLQGV